MLQEGGDGGVGEGNGGRGAPNTSSSRAMIKIQGMIEKQGWRHEEVNSLRRRVQKACGALVSAMRVLCYDYVIHTTHSRCLG